MYYKHILLLSASLSLAACGGSSGSGGTTTGGADGGAGSSVTLDDYNKIELADIEPTVLEPATEASLKLLMANSLRMSTLASTTLEPVDGVAVPIVAEQPSVVDTPEGAEPSDTNTIVSGVDEADYIKTDSQYLYIAAQREIPVATSNSIDTGSGISKTSLDFASLSPIINQPAAMETYTRIVSMDPAQASVEDVGSILFDNMDSGTLPELFLNENDAGETQSLIAVRSHYESVDYAVSCVAPEGAACLSPVYYSGKSTAQVSINPALNQEGVERFFSFDGYLKKSRKIDNVLYLVLDYSPRLYTLLHGVATQEAVEDNEKQLADVDTQELLPKVRIDGLEQNYLQASDCYIPKGISSDVAVSSLSSLVAIDLNDGSILSSRCVSSPVQGIYASQDAIYFGGSSTFFGGWNSALTTLHKFELNEGNIEYRSTGSVVGTMGWSTSDYSMDAKDGDLRIVTSNWEESDEGNTENVHRVSVLRDSLDSDEMDMIAQIPSAERPEVIGKPNEQIESVRFRDDKAYIVTFLRTDPLYVINLSDPEDPFVAGELEIPGYSKYLHILDDNTLLGVGYDADSRGVNNGIKVSLFDVSNDNPSEITSIILGDSYSSTPATGNLHAISFSQPTSDQVRFAFSANLYEDRTFLNSGLRQFEINGLSTGQQSLEAAGEILVENSTNSLYSFANYYDRSVLFGDSVFYVNDTEIWTSFWDQSENAMGPY